MNAFRLAPIVALACGLSGSMAMATNVGLTTVEQSVNLGTRSDPTRIPLGKVGVISNYNFGIHRIADRNLLFSGAAAEVGVVLE